MSMALGSLKLAQTGMQLGSDLCSIGQAFLNNASQIAKIGGEISASHSREMQYKMQAKNYGRAANDALKAAGRCQEQGRLAIENRMVKLGQTKGAINAGAAGSGLDVSSRTVRKVLKDSIKSAYNDAAVMAENEQQMTQEKINERTTMQQNKVWSEYNAEVESINQNLMFNQMKLANKSLTNQLIGGALSTGANLLGGASNTMIGFNMAGS